MDLILKTNLQRFGLEAFIKLIYNDNQKTIEMILDKNLLDIEEKSYDFLCKAIISDSRKTANYLSKRFEHPIDLTKMQYEDKSLFFQIAKTSHYSRVYFHSFLNEALEESTFFITDEEKDKMSNFYKYNETFNQPFLDYVEQYSRKHKMEKELMKKDINNKKIKI